MMNKISQISARIGWEMQDRAETMGVGGLSLNVKKDKDRANLYSQRVQPAINLLFVFLNLLF